MTDRNQHDSRKQARRSRNGAVDISQAGGVLHTWVGQTRSELWQNIMPFWLQHSVDSARGGFVGRMSNECVVDTHAHKGLVLNARLLWAFSAMHSFTQNPVCLRLANRALDYILTRFWDTEYGGAFWTLRPDGSVLNTSKKIYGQAFLIYAMAQHYLCTSVESSLKIAQQVFKLLETHALDRDGLGYAEVYNRDWSLAAEQRLGDEDMDARKSMNNHLHLLEAFTNLYRAWKHPAVADRLKMLLGLFCEKILNPDTGHLDLFFDEHWNRKSKTISFGHDIEASWLLCEAAREVNEPVWIEKTEAVSARMADTVYKKALDKNGGLFYEIDESGQLNPIKEHWCQAEAAVGFLNAYQITQKKYFYDAAQGVWNFIRSSQVDREHGDWFMRLDAENRPNRDLPKISEWKDPYHNSRCCIELARRLASLLKTPAAAGTKEALIYE